MLLPVHVPPLLVPSAWYHRLLPEHKVFPPRNVGWFEVLHIRIFRVVEDADERHQRLHVRLVSRPPYLLARRLSRQIPLSILYNTLLLHDINLGNKIKFVIHMVLVVTIMVLRGGATRAHVAAAITIVTIIIT